MTEASGLSLLAKPIIAILVPLAKKANRLHKEKLAAASPIPGRASQNPLDVRFSETLTRLGAIDQNDEWWRNMLAKAGQKYVQPVFFNNLSVQSWLGVPQVQEDLKNLAMNRLLDQADDLESRDRLSIAYMTETGEAQHFANDGIDAAVNTLLANAYANMSDGETTISAMIGEATGQLLEGQKEILSQHTPTEDPIHGDTAREQLNKIIRRRGSPGCDSKTEICDLVSRIDSGDLSRTPKTIQSDVYLWAARLHVNPPEVQYLAKEFLWKADRPDQEMVAIVSAWLDIEGDTEKALKNLREFNTPDTRTTLFKLLARSKGFEQALKWYDKHDDRNSESFFSPLGWHSLAIHLAQADRWNEAIEILERLTEKKISDFPLLAFTCAILHVGKIIPKKDRPILIDGNIPLRGFDVQEGATVEKHKSAARQHFTKARELYVELDASLGVKSCVYWLFWLGLITPSEHDGAVQQIIKMMGDPKQAIMLIDLALEFEIEFESGPVLRYLERLSITGGLKPEEQLAHLRIVQKDFSHDEILSFLLEHKGDLLEVLTEGSLISLRFRTLIEAGRLIEAEQELENNGDKLPSEFNTKFRLMISEREGNDIGKELISLYESDDGRDTETLINLVNHLTRTNQWKAAVPYARQLLDNVKTAENLLTLIQGMQHLDKSADDILALIEENIDLANWNTDRGLDIFSAKAWWLSNVGAFVEAKELCDRLIKCRDIERDINLEINIAFSTGDWEHFTAVVDRVFDRRNELSSSLLTRLALISADQDVNRAMTLLNTATANNPDDAILLSSAYHLASKFGREADAGEWLEKAIQLSDQETGPMQSISLQELVDRAPAYNEQRAANLKKIRQGEMPIHIVPYLFNLPISKILIGQAHRNEEEKNHWHRLDISIRSGIRGINDASNIKRPTLDLTTLYILEDNDLLGLFLKTMDTVFISPLMMEVLFREQQDVKFHQPSIVEQAHRINHLISSNKIKVLPKGNVPDELESEVGNEMGLLLSTAKKAEGRVVASLPIHKAGSLDFQAANLGDYASTALKTTQLLDYLEPNLDPQVAETARSYLAAVDKGDATGGKFENGMPLFIDDLALNYLDTANVLETLCNQQDISIAFYAHERVLELINASRHGNHTASLIDRLRKNIRDGIRTKKIKFLPKPPQIKGDDEKYLYLNLIRDIVHSSSDSDSVCIDDRNTGRHQNMAYSDEKTVPMLGVIDLIIGLAKQNKLPSDDLKSRMTRLRKQGFVLLPVIEEHLLEELLAASINSSGDLVENSHLKALRQNTQQVRSQDILQFPQEVPWINQIHQAGLQTLIKLWGESFVSITHAKSASKWLFHALSIWQPAWINSTTPITAEDIDGLAVSSLDRLLAVIPQIKDKDRKIEFSIWLEEDVIKPLAPANQHILDTISETYATRLAETMKEIDADA
jgi:tetratricopeptide (TPR) repeat protein